MNTFTLAMLCAAGAYAENEMRFLADEEGLKMKEMCFGSDGESNCVWVPMDDQETMTDKNGNPIVGSATHDHDHDEKSENSVDSFLADFFSEDGSMSFAVSAIAASAFLTQV